MMNYSLAVAFKQDYLLEKKKNIYPPNDIGILLWISLLYYVVWNVSVNFDVQNSEFLICQM